MRRSQFGGALPKVLLLIVFLGLLVGYWWWRGQHGVIGNTPPLPFNTSGYIAFFRQDAGRINLYTVKADGTGEQKLTDDENAKRDLAWSPDGKKICYAGEVKDQGSIAYQIFLAGSGQPIQASFGSGSKLSPQWRADGKQIAYLMGGKLKMQDPNGESVEQVYPPPHKNRTDGDSSDESQDSDALKKPPLASFQWSPKGATIAAVEVMEGEVPIAPGQGNWWVREKGADSAPALTVEAETIILLAGGEANPVRLVRTNANHLSYSWFPSGDRIAVAIGGQAGQYGLAVFRTDEPEIPAAGLLGCQGYIAGMENPSVSPDGAKVAYEVWRLEGPENRELLGIAILPADGEMLELKTPADIAKLKLVVKGKATNPQWSADGSRLLYSMPGSGGRDIWTVNADGSNPVNLTKGKGDNFGAAWSPSGKR